jgi:prepilin-type N-terminal cleavage/methylation domain-containing protein
MQIFRVMAKSFFYTANQRREHSSRPLRDSGFTIIEVILVLAIVGIMFFVIFGVVPEAQRNERNHSRKRTMELAAAALEEYNVTHGDYPRTPAQQSAFLATTPELGKYYTIEFRDTHDPHDTYPAMDTIAIQFAHWCNKYGNGDTQHDPIAGTDTISRLYVVWTLLEPDHPSDPTRRFAACVDNYDHSGG